MVLFKNSGHSYVFSELVNTLKIKHSVNKVYDGTHKLQRELFCTNSKLHSLFTLSGTTVAFHVYISLLIFLIDWLYMISHSHSCNSMDLGTLTWLRQLAEVQTERQNSEQRGLKWHWTWLIVGARWAGQSISETADLPGFSHTTISRVYWECSEKEKISSEQQLCGWKCFVDMRMNRLVWDDEMQFK